MFNTFKKRQPYDKNVTKVKLVEHTNTSIHLKSNVAEALRNNKMKNKRVSATRKEQDTHPCSWIETYKSNHVNPDYTGGGR